MDYLITMIFFFRSLEYEFFLYRWTDFDDILCVYFMGPWMVENLD